MNTIWMGIVTVEATQKTEKRIKATNRTPTIVITRMTSRTHKGRKTGDPEAPQTHEVQETIPPTIMSTAQMKVDGATPVTAATDPRTHMREGK